MTMWVINISSYSFDFLVVETTRERCLRAFSRAWNDWCKTTGADPYYWGEAGDKWAEVTPEEVEVGVVYMDRAPYRV